MRAFVVKLSPVLSGILILSVFLILGFGLLYGFARLIQWAEPVLHLLAALSILLFVCGVLPFSLARSLRSRMSGYAIVLSAVCGGCTWLISFMYILLYLKAWALLFIWFFQISAPAAVIILLFDEKYPSAAFLAIAFAAAYAMRFYASWLAARYGGAGPGTGSKYRRIDGDVYEGEVVRK